MAPTKDHFPKVREAREALKEKALELFEAYLLIIKDAHASGNFEVAAQHMQWLIEHMPKGDDGERVIDESAAKPKSVETPKGPTIQIGIALSPQKPKELPSVEVIDVTDVNPDKN